ncbi:unnamed protein product [Penicillium roqueforti FM164]|uniref:Genomic scaffold, ProqFM164S01 n=1 Tax=Penicillium roqueforti (strain FM164) TaxID=1365484 RepID=W6PTY1_PENRF|nr:unnamed protein product [Penicillium roqueforti FM164]
MWYRLFTPSPHMYGLNGKLLRTLDDVGDDAVRRASFLSKDSGSPPEPHSTRRAIQWRTH